MTPKYYRKIVAVKAWQMDNHFKVMPDKSDGAGGPGDYLVENPDGSQYVVRKDVFESMYELAEDSYINAVDELKRKYGISIGTVLFGQDGLFGIVGPCVVTGFAGNSLHALVSVTHGHVKGCWFCANDLVDELEKGNVIKRKEQVFAQNKEENDQRC